MEVITSSSPFGNPTRTRVLLVVHLLGESYPRELARILGRPLSVVQKAIRSLEVDGLLAGRIVGRMRLYRINPNYFASSELRKFLSRLADSDPELQNRLDQIRKRPRQSGKPLWR